MDHAAALQLAQVIAVFTCYFLIQFVIHPRRHCDGQSRGRGNDTTKVFFARSWKLLTYHFLCSLTDCRWVSEYGWYCQINLSVGFEDKECGGGGRGK